MLYVPAKGIDKCLKEKKLIDWFLRQMFFNKVECKVIKLLIYGCLVYLYTKVRRIILMRCAYYRERINVVNR